MLSDAKITMLYYIIDDLFKVMHQSNPIMNPKSTGAVQDGCVYDLTTFTIKRSRKISFGQCFSNQRFMNLSFNACRRKPLKAILLAAVVIVFGQTAFAQIKFDNIPYGASYYHEYMPAERLEKAVRLMQEAGVSVIRLAESS